MSVKLTKKQKECLVSHYICDMMQNQFLIPTELIHLCTIFFDEVTYWTLSSPFIQRSLLSTTNGCGVIGPSFTCAQHIECQLILYPNGSQPQYDGYTEVFFRIKRKCFQQHLISEITAYFELGCIESGTEYRNLGRFTVTDAWSNWYPFNMKYSELQHWSASSLTFSVYVDILRIRYRAIKMASPDQQRLQSKAEYQQQDIAMNASSEYQWSIHGQLLRRLNFCDDNKRFYSPTQFDDKCWCLYCTPNTNKLYFHLYLRLIRLPGKLSAVKIRFCLQLNEDCNTRTPSMTVAVSKFNIEQNSFKICTLKPSQMVNLNALNIALKLEILNVYDRSGHKVPPTQWRQYGIVGGKVGNAQTICGRGHCNAVSDKKLMRWKRALQTHSKQIWHKMMRRRQR